MEPLPGVSQDRAVDERRAEMRAAEERNALEKHVASLVLRGIAVALFGATVVFTLGLVAALVLFDAVPATLGLVSAAMGVASFLCWDQSRS